MDRWTLHILARDTKREIATVEMNHLSVKQVPLQSVEHATAYEYMGTVRSIREMGYDTLER